MDIPRVSELQYKVDKSPNQPETLLEPANYLPQDKHSVTATRQNINEGRDAFGRDPNIPARYRTTREAVTS